MSASAADPPGRRFTVVERLGCGTQAALTFVVPGIMVNRMVKSSPEALDRTFSALSDPTRRSILERLGRGPATISELAHPFGISLPGLLKHVRILEQADLVTTQKHGRTRECRLGSEQLDDAARWIQTYRGRWEGRLDRLGSYLQQHKGGPT
jgi:DNA-binding transcriptional ArsR family regulator